MERDLERALAARPAAVLVTNPTALHLPVALAAARTGAHLFIEKPLADSLEGVAELEREVRSRGLVVQLGFQYRLHPGLQAVKSWIEAGALGRIVAARASWGEWLPGWHPWEDYRRAYSARRSLGGGVIRTLSHPFDYLRWLLGEVESVSAEAGRLSGLEIDVEDTAVVTLRFASGAIGSVSLDYVARPKRHRLEILGRSGRAEWREDDGRARLYDNGGQILETAASHGFNRNDLFREELRAFLEAAVRGQGGSPGLEDGVMALRIALAAARAAEEGLRVRI